MSGRVKVSDGSSWPRPDDDDFGLAWRLTYAEPTKSDLLAAASVISAYEYLICSTTAERRALVIREVRADLATRPDPTTTAETNDREADR